MPSIWMPDAPPASAGAEDDEFADASAGVPGGWTEVDHGSILTVDEDEAGLEFTISSHAGQSLAGIYKSIPAGSFSYWTKVEIGGLGVTTGAFAGIALWQDATDSAGDAVLFGLLLDATSGRLNAYNYSAYNTLSTNIFNYTITVDAGPTSIYLKVTRTSTTYSMFYSTDGVGWERVYNTTIAITPTHIGPAFDSYSSPGATQQARFQFWRYLASDVGLNALMEGDRITVAAA